MESFIFFCNLLKPVQFLIYFLQNSLLHLHLILIRRYMYLAQIMKIKNSIETQKGIFLIFRILEQSACQPAYGLLIVHLWVNNCIGANHIGNLFWIWFQKHTFVGSFKHESMCCAVGDQCIIELCILKFH